MFLAIIVLLSHIMCYISAGLRGMLVDDFLVPCVY